MRIKFINKDTLSFKIINVKGGTLEETLKEANNSIPDLDISTLKRNDSILSFDKYIADIIYVGVPKSEHRGRRHKDWSEQIKVFNTFYNKSLTAKALAVKSGLPIGQIYYLSKKTEQPLAAGQHGRKH